mgnify:CR=1 FL=1
MIGKGKEGSIIQKGDLVLRGGVMFIVLDIGDYEHHGYCQVSPVNDLNTHIWILSRLLMPV